MESRLDRAWATVGESIRRVRYEIDEGACDDDVFNFFFQAEDGIRDRLVTGVQTCALPISNGDGGVTC